MFIKVNENVVTNEKVVADLFNGFFVNVAASLKQLLKHSNFEKKKTVFLTLKLMMMSLLILPCLFIFVVVTCNKIYRPRLYRTKASKIGPDILSPGITFIITFIINKSITSGIFPTIRKQAKVNPLFKNGAKDELNNYRPISILPTLSKIIEKWISMKLVIFR